ncbi:hypothetical protein ACHAWF_007548 [Thalassiosira exigua]
MCDVSGSMCCPIGGGGKGTCMDVACALSLLLTDSLPEDSTFRGKVLTFSGSPEFVDLTPERKDELTIEALEEAESLEDMAAHIPDLAGRVSKLKSSDWGCNTNFFATMQHICDVAVANDLKADDIGGLELVVFSDMEFDHAQYGSKWDQQTMLEKLRQLFATVNPPKIVFWNLRASFSGSGIGGDAEEGGVVLLSGFSAGLLRKYLSWDLRGNSGLNFDVNSGQESSEMDINPMKAMLACLQDPLYKGLQLEKNLQEWEALVSEEQVTERAEKVRGKNGELVYASNNSALVAFFFEAVPGIAIDGLEKQLAAAFKENPTLALRLLFNLGTVRKHAAGKADRENFQAVEEMAGNVPSQSQVDCKVRVPEGAAELGHVCALRGRAQAGPRELCALLARRAEGGVEGAQAKARKSR